MLESIKCPGIKIFGNAFPFQRPDNWPKVPNGEGMDLTAAKGFIFVWEKGKKELQKSDRLCIGFTLFTGTGTGINSRTNLDSKTDHISNRTFEIPFDQIQADTGFFFFDNIPR